MGRALNSKMVFAIAVAVGVAIGGYVFLTGGAEPERSKVAPTGEPQTEVFEAAPIPNCAQTPSTAETPRNRTVEIQVRVTPLGFLPATLYVEQGARVRLLFIFDDPNRSNHHLIVMQEYDSPGVLDAFRPTSSVDFIADKPGIFGFSCEFEYCIGHQNLQNGSIVVCA